MHCLRHPLCSPSHDRFAFTVFAPAFIQPYKRMHNDAQRFPLFAGALLAALGVALGAFAAHGLRAVLDANALAWWQTAVQYQMWHATGLIALGAARLPRSLLPAVLLTAGTVIFAASLYVMALGGPRWLGAVTPLGGSLMIAGWLVLAWRVLRSTTHKL